MGMQQKLRQMPVLGQLGPWDIYTKGITEPQSHYHLYFLDMKLKALTVPLFLHLYVIIHHRQPISLTPGI